MADHTTKPIKDVKIGDKVLATDPATGKSTAQSVTRLHRNQDTDLADVTVVSAGRATTLHTTWHHPFWNTDVGHWTEAKDLTPGTHLGTGDGSVETVIGVRAWAGSHDMRDLTVNDIHTYYVIAGNTPVLVHNCGGMDPVSGGLDDATYGSIEGAHGTEVAEGVDYQVQRMHDGSATAGDHEIPGIGHDPAALGDYFASWRGRMTHVDTRTGANVAYDQSRRVLIAENSYMIHGYRFSFDSFQNSGRYVAR
jgi:hypothetical protein